jgi:hypothetical protein
MEWRRLKRRPDAGAGLHELAGCRLLTAASVIDGYVDVYAAGVLRLRLEAPLTGRAVGDPVTVQVLDPVRGECTYRGLLGRAVGLEIDVVVTQAVDQRQRRAAARAAYHCTCAAVVAGDDGPEQFVVTVLDVSATGLRFSSKRRLSGGTVLTVRLPADRGTLELRARVVRLDEARAVWRYGCELVEPDDHTREALYRLVMRLQREARRAALARE